MFVLKLGLPHGSPLLNIIQTPKVLRGLLIDSFAAGGVVSTGGGVAFTLPVRHRFKDIYVPKPGKGGYFRRVIHYPDKYTIKPIPYTNLAGRDPVTGHVVVGTLGGGIKWPLLWVDYTRHVPQGSPPLVERVLEVFPEPTRTAHVALVGSGDRLRYILATENMKPGDIIKTSSELTRIAVRPNEGDAYPLGSLAVNTVVCNVEPSPGFGGYFARGAGTQCTILRKIGNRVVISIPSKREISVDQMCIGVVGRISNIIHNTIPIGSANRLRHLGYRPRSGLWHRKTGKHGRKIRAPPPLQDFVPPEDLPQPCPKIRLTLPEYPYHEP